MTERLATTSAEAANLSQEEARENIGVLIASLRTRLTKPVAGVKREPFAPDQRRDIILLRRLIHTAGIPRGSLEHEFFNEFKVPRSTTLPWEQAMEQEGPVNPRTLLEQFLQGEIERMGGAATGDLAEDGHDPHQDAPGSESRPDTGIVTGGDISTMCASVKAAIEGAFDLSKNRQSYDERIKAGIAWLYRRRGSQSVGDLARKIGLKGSQVYYFADQFQGKRDDTLLRLFQRGTSAPGGGTGDTPPARRRTDEGASAETDVDSARGTKLGLDESVAKRLPLFQKLIDDKGGDTRAFVTKLEDLVSGFTKGQIYSHVHAFLLGRRNLPTKLRREIESAFDLPAKHLDAGCYTDKELAKEEKEAAEPFPPSGRTTVRRPQGRATSQPRRAPARREPRIPLPPPPEESTTLVPAAPGLSSPQEASPLTSVGQLAKRPPEVIQPQHSSQVLQLLEALRGHRIAPIFTGGVQTPDGDVTEFRTTKPDHYAAFVATITKEPQKPHEEK